MTDLAVLRLDRALGAVLVDDAQPDREPTITLTFALHHGQVITERARRRR
jgi:hypothetical protein